MRSTFARLILIAAAVVASMGFSSAAQAGPPDVCRLAEFPCNAKDRVEDKVQEVVETCQKAYCQFP